MKITDLRARCVAIPMSAQLRHNRGVHPGYFARTLVELMTDEGIIGLGEVGYDQRKALENLKHRIIGLDPFHLERIKLKAYPARYSAGAAGEYAAIEMACLDIQGKVLNRPVSDLLGGALRDRVPFIAYLFWRYERPDGKDDECAEDIADYCEALHHELGVGSMKMKAGVMDPSEEARVLELCRQRLGPNFGLRIDPNGSWSIPTAVRIGKRLESLDLEYYEDPSRGLHGNAAVRSQVRIPVATNMFPAKFDDLAPGIQLGSVDIILTDIHMWDGPRGVKDLAAVCGVFGLGVAMHSGVEFGVELAAMLHTTATIPHMHFAADAHYHYLTDDIIVGGKMPYENGAIRVPTGPGLGVQLDNDKIAYYERFYEEKGDFRSRFFQDPRRPDWFPPHSY